MQREGQSLRHRLSRPLRAAGDDGRLRRAVALFACALPAAGSEPQAIAGSATIVIHGQGRVTSEPAGAIDCPGDCSHTFTGSTEPDAPRDADDRLGDGAERLLRRDGRLHGRAERLRLHDPRLLPSAREAPGLAER